MFGVLPLHLPEEEVRLSEEEFGVPMELVGLTKVYLKFKPIGESWYANILCDMFAIRLVWNTEMHYCHCFSTLPQIMPLGGFRQTRLG